MKKFLNNYKSSLILLLSVIVGGIIGVIFKEDAKVLQPLGDIFLNLLFVAIVPLIFVTITSSLTKKSEKGHFRKVVSRIFLSFVITSLVAVIIGCVATKLFPFVDSSSVEILEGAKVDTDLNILQRTASLLTTSDFYLLLSRDNIVALLIFSILFGLSIRKMGDDGKVLVDILNALSKAINNFITIIMYYAPIGIACYFASLVGTFGDSITKGYLTTFLLYLAVSVFMYFIVYTIYAYLSGGKAGVKAYYKNIMPTTVTALSTCSSAASIPVNTQVAKKIGVSEEVADMAIPLGTTFHKDGSIIGSVFKIMFLTYLFGLDVSIGKLIFVSLVATLLVTAVPIGGGTISEAFILSLIGAPLTALPMLTIVATIIDAPATVLNVVGDTTVCMMSSRMIYGKKWIKKA